MTRDLGRVGSVVCDRAPVAGSPGLVDAVTLAGIEMEFDPVGIVQHEEPPDRGVDDG